LPPREERAGERRRFGSDCPSLRLSPRSFLSGRKRKILVAFNRLFRLVGSPFKNTWVAA